MRALALCQIYIQLKDIKTVLKRKPPGRQDPGKPKDGRELQLRTTQEMGEQGQRRWQCAVNPEQLGSRGRSLAAFLLPKVSSSQREPSRPQTRMCRVPSYHGSNCFIEFAFSWPTMRGWPCPGERAAALLSWPRTPFQDRRGRVLV